MSGNKRSLEMNMHENKIAENQRWQYLVVNQIEMSLIN